jgi:tRNA threonylcarbamoyladenosine biosynthesis protein TsaE
VLVNVYRQPNGSKLFHLDAYRIQETHEAVDLDIDAMIEKGPLVIEWADRIQGALPGEYLRVQLHWVDYEQRDLIITARGVRYESLLSDFRQQVFGVY